MVLEIIVPPEKAGERIDVFLTGLEGIPTRSIAQKLLAGGNVFCLHKQLQKNYKVAAGDVIVCTLPAPEPCETMAEDIPLDIMYEDDHLLVVNKPRGLVVHPAAGNWHGTLVNALLHHCKGKLSGIGGVLRPGIVHRLDKDTSGAMVVAKDDVTHQGLAAQIADRSMVRIYNAVCFGVLKQDKFKIDAAIGRHPVDRKKMMVFAANTKAASYHQQPQDVSSRRIRNAITHVNVLERLEKYTLISAQLETGRTHQIRAHMAHVNHPVLGDETYTNRTQPLFLKGQQGQILHATQLAFNHPITGLDVIFTAPWPEYFQQVVDKIKEY